MRNVIVIMFIAFLLFGCASRDNQLNQTLENLTNQTVFTPLNLTNETNSTNQTISNLITDFNLSTTVINVTVGENKTETTKEGNGLQFGDYALLLDDVTVIGPNECAVIRIFDKNLATTLHEGIACKGKDYYWIAPDKHKYRFLITEIAAGYLNNEIWAKVFIYG